MAFSQNLVGYGFHRRTALVIGNERTGLTPEVLEQLDDVVEIPVWGLPYSYNVATATAMALYEYWLKRWFVALVFVQPSKSPLSEMAKQGKLASLGSQRKAPRPSLEPATTTSRMCIRCGRCGLTATTRVRTSS